MAFGDVTFDVEEIEDVRILDDLARQSGVGRVQVSQEVCSVPTITDRPRDPDNDAALVVVILERLPPLTVLTPQRVGHLRRIIAESARPRTAESLHGFVQPGVP